MPISLFDNVCGLYYLKGTGENLARHYLPRRALRVVSHVTHLASRTELKQVYFNPEAKDLSNVRYCLPRYGGISVVDFRCELPTRTIVGKVKEKDIARKAFGGEAQASDALVLSGRLPKPSDAFTAEIGEIPSGAEIIIEVVYIDELTFDGANNAARFTMSSAIAPHHTDPRRRKGLFKNAKHTSVPGHTEIIVGFSMIQGLTKDDIRSINHPVTRTEERKPAGAPLRKLVVKFNEDMTDLGKDFILEIAYKHSEKPYAFLELHPSHSHHQAVMVTLPSSLACSQPQPEIVLLCDFSGGRGVNVVVPLYPAVKVFLKSLRPGTLFNICSFSTTHRFAFEQSREYDESSLNEALKQLKTFEVVYKEPTDILSPLKDIIKKRSNNYSLQIMLVSNSGVRNEQKTTDFIRKTMKKSKNPFRISSVSIGKDPHFVTSRIAEYGRGMFIEAQPQEKLDNKLVQMLGDVQMLTNTSNAMRVIHEHDAGSTKSEANESDSGILRAKLDSKRQQGSTKQRKQGLSPNPQATQKEKYGWKQSLQKAGQTHESEAQPSAVDVDPHPATLASPGTKRAAKVEVPKILQVACRKISAATPPLITFYLLMSQQSGENIPKAVTYRGIRVPIDDVHLDQAIHQLAARQAVRELHLERGWLHHFEDKDEVLLKDSCEEELEERVKREDVRLGEHFQACGKYCSFVAEVSRDASGSQEEYLLNPQVPISDTKGGKVASSRARDSIGESIVQPSHRRTKLPPMTQRTLVKRPANSDNSLSSAHAPPSPSKRKNDNNPYGDAKNDIEVSPTKKSKTLFTPMTLKFSKAPKPPKSPGNPDAPLASIFPSLPKKMTDEAKFYMLVDLQKWDGSWEPCDELTALFGLSSTAWKGMVAKCQWSGDVLATVCAVTFLEGRLKRLKDSWVLMVEKAKDWVYERVHDWGENVECFNQHCPLALRATIRSLSGLAGQEQDMIGRTLSKFGQWLKKEDEDTQYTDNGGEQPQEQGHDEGQFADRRPPRKVVPNLPRPITFRRLESEKRDRLSPTEPSFLEKRAASVDRRASDALDRNLSQPPPSRLSMSAPDAHSLPSNSDTDILTGIGAQGWQYDKEKGCGISDAEIGKTPNPRLSNIDDLTDPDGFSQGPDDHALQEEVDSKWILNLSMQFRDMSDREKFFITYAEEPNKWRRVTVSCDYREASPDSLEADLKSLHYQRDKSARIYEAIRDSLPDIQFYSTVTNLKLSTSDERLHLHVTEDINEIIPYPDTRLLRHISCPRVRESAVAFDSHLSGFVYKVKVNGRYLIKKEIPGPEAVEEFLYEINALSNLRGSKSVINFEGLIVDDNETLIKGLLISVADRGTLVDLIYDFKGTKQMAWPRRERWAKQIVQGLSEIHEAGYVQGDFTLSNIVIDNNDDAKIIDINRRGCPVGWESPEIARLIESGQRISIYIGVKSDLFQLGMVLWALAEEQDEPERHERPLQLPSTNHDIPTYFREMVQLCLSDEPRDRLSAKELYKRFPNLSEAQSAPIIDSMQSLSSLRASEKEYIDPADAVSRADIEAAKQSKQPARNVAPSTAYQTQQDAGASTNYLTGESDFQHRSGTPGTSPSINRGRSRRLSDFSHRSIDPDGLDVEYGHSQWDDPEPECPPRPGIRDLVNKISATERHDPQRDDNAATIYPRTKQTDSQPVIKTNLQSPPPQQNAPNRASFHERISKSSQAPNQRNQLELPPKKTEPQPTNPRPRQPDQTTFHNRLSQILQQHADDTARQEAHEATPPSRQSTRQFGPPLHQDSGFDEQTGNYELVSQPASAEEAVKSAKILGSVAEGGGAAEGTASDVAEEEKKEGVRT
ncbi:hypothetical protein LTS18_000094 [Coniosporium uncinatum]|uniref:Uncharacterized protein n=1 Tax=Coniosporium uncinatum TaxID=93489 RepID=A0ACC3DZ67_9PEZI|nr:hypothetical protein LTS18_000094 [Coniosporium uncinatum]